MKNIKNINEKFTDEEFTELKEAKKDLTWREAILKFFRLNK